MTPHLESEFREFVAGRANRLARFAFLLCRDWHQAEDAVQRAFSRLYRKWPKISRENPDAYVRRIVVNTIHDDRRLAWFRREHPTHEPPERVLPDPADAGVDRLTVLHALARLPRRQQLAIVLRYWEDMSVEQTAALMGCSTGTVKSQCFHGLATLRALLTDSTAVNA